MSVTLPRLPERVLLADLCREAAATEHLQPQLIEKDFYLTRLLWALGQTFGDQLLLKGGTLLSKVDLGFVRMSEDADLVLPGAPDSRKLQNVRRMHGIRDALKELGPLVGVTARFPAGELLEKGAHCIWLLDYPSDFGPQGLRLEVSIRPLLRPAREVRLHQLLSDRLAGDARGAASRRRGTTLGTGRGASASSTTAAPVRARRRPNSRPRKFARCASSP